MYLRIILAIFLVVLAGCMQKKSHSYLAIWVDGLTERSNNGDHAAQATLSLMYFSGSPVKKDIQKAATLLQQASQDIYAVNKVYKSAAAKNDPAAEFGLYVMWSNGWGVPLNMDIAKMHLKRSAELGYPQATQILNPIKSE